MATLKPLTRNRKMALVGAVGTITCANTAGIVYDSHAQAFGLDTHAIGLVFLGLALVSFSAAIALLAKPAE